MELEVGPATTVLFEVYIDQERCKLSCVCIDLCSMGVFVRQKHRVYPEKSELCCSCFKCSEFCPEHAISTRWILRA